MGLVCFVKGSLLGLLQFTHLEVYLVDMSIRGKKDGFMNILKQLSLIWLGRKLGSTVKLQHFLQGFPDSSVRQINQHFLRSFLCWRLLKKGYIFRILSTLANTSVYFWLIQLSKTSLLGQIFFLAKFPWPLRGANSFKQSVYLHMRLSIGSAGQISFGKL